MPVSWGKLIACLAALAIASDARAQHTGAAPAAIGAAGQDELANVLARQRAMMAQAVATIAQHAGRPASAAREEAYALLSDVLDTLYPYALEQSADGALTPFQAAYAEALGWRGAGRAAYTQRQEIARLTLGGETVCATRWSGDNAIARTLAAAYHGRTGVAVFRLLTDEDGQVTRVDVAHAAPVQDFSHSVAPVLSRLRAVRSNRAVEGCAMPRVHFQAVIFGGER